MRLFQKELLLYNDSFDNWSVIETDTNSWNTVLTYAYPYAVTNKNIFSVGTAEGEVLQSQDGKNYLLKQPKIDDTDTPFTESIRKIACSYKYDNCYVILTDDNEIYFSDNNLETVKKQRDLGGTYLDVAYANDMFFIVGEEGFCAKGTLIRRSTGSFRLTWEQEPSFTSRTIHKIKQLNNTVYALDFAYAQGLTYKNGIYQYTPSGWNNVFQEITAGTGWKEIVDITYYNGTLIAIRSDNKLNLHNITTNTPLIFNDIAIEGSGITYCGDYYIACGTDGKIVVSDDLTNWKEFTVQDPQGQDLSLEYIASNDETGDIVAMDSSYIAYINTELLDKLMEL